MSDVDYKRAAKLSDLTRLMSDEPVAEQSAVGESGWQARTVESILDDLTGALNVPGWAIGWNHNQTPRSPTDDAEAVFFSRQSEHIQQGYYAADRRLTYGDRVRGTHATWSTAADVIAAACSVPGVESVDLREDTSTSRHTLTVLVTQVAANYDTLELYRERIIGPVRHEVELVAPVGVRVRVEMRTPLYLLNEACERTSLDLRRGLQGMVLNDDMLQGIARRASQLMVGYLQRHEQYLPFDVQRCLTLVLIRDATTLAYYIDARLMSQDRRGRSYARRIHLGF